jgi:hypothetical protein
LKAHLRDYGLENSVGIRRHFTQTPTFPEKRHGIVHPSPPLRRPAQRSGSPEFAGMSLCARRGAWDVTGAGDQACRRPGTRGGAVHSGPAPLVFMGPGLRPWRNRDDTWGVGVAWWPGRCVGLAPATNCSTAGWRRPWRLVRSAPVAGLRLFRPVPACGLRPIGSGTGLQFAGIGRAGSVRR